MSAGLKKEVIAGRESAVEGIHGGVFWVEERDDV
jgi:hypothetical protein